MCIDLFELLFSGLERTIVCVCLCVYVFLLKKMFIGALFIIAPKWKQPKLLSIGEWIEEYS